MKRLIALLIFGFASLAGAQFVPQAIGAYNFTSGSWAPFASLGGTASGFAPPAFALYCQLSNGSWTPWTAANCGSGSSGGDAITSPNGTLTVGGTAIATTLDFNLANPNTWTAAQKNSTAGVASTGAITLSGAPFSGSNANSFGQLNIAWGTVPATTALNVNGAAITVMEPNGGTSDIFNGLVNGVSDFSVSSAGAGIFASSLTMKGPTLHLGSATSIINFENAAGSGSSIGMDRAADGLLEINGGAQGNSSGSLKAAVYESGGTKFTASGCTSITATVGAASAGKFTIGANTCTVTITFNGATGFTAPNGFSCHANDETTAAGNTGMYFSAPASAATAALVIPATAAASDVIDFACTAF